MRSRKKRIRFRDSRGIYVLPNLFTSASLFSGFYAIIAAMQDKYEAAATAILISAVLDGLDGRIARLTHTTSHFGTEFDSLADVIAFGVAPGVLAFQWALRPFGRLGWLAAFLFVICGALRLARFNVQKSTVDPNYFRGLPIPAAACVVASLVLFVSDFGGIPDRVSVIILVMIYVLSFLMVSTVTYQSFKKLDIRNRKPFKVLVSIILLCVVLATEPIVLFFLLTLGYALSGPVHTGYRWGSMRGLLPRQQGDGAEEGQTGPETAAADKKERAEAP